MTTETTKAFIDRIELASRDEMLLLSLEITIRQDLTCEDRALLSAAIRRRHILLTGVGL